MKYSGIVIHGDGYGRKLGYPTANIEITEPPAGVFAGTVLYKDTEYRAAIFVTTKRPILEAHLLDFDGDLYGKTLTVEIHTKLREPIEFEDEAKLRVAIRDDVVGVREYFSIGRAV